MAAAVAATAAPYYTHASSSSSTLNNGSERTSSEGSSDDETLASWPTVISKSTLRSECLWVNGNSFGHLVFTVSARNIAEIEAGGNTLLLRPIWVGGREIQS